MYQKSFWALIFLVLLTACDPSKKLTRKKAGALHVDLDSIEITVSRENPYRGSEPRDFDLKHTRLEVRFDYEKSRLYGKATLTLSPHFYPQQKLRLDAKQFDIHKVALLSDKDMQPLRFTYDSLVLEIELPRLYTKEETLSVFIDYTAKPEERQTGGSAAITSDKGLYFINPLGKDTAKPVQIWTQGETEASSCWFPTIDKPNQKTTQEIFLTRDKKYVSLSNGVLVSSKDNGDGSVTDHWRMSIPHAPYLFMMTVGDFDITRDRWRDLEVTYYTEKEYTPYAREIFGNTPEMMEFFSRKFGFDYPWAKYAQIIVRDYVSGAMENTSATLHGEFLQRTSRERLDETYEDIISHELAHQWFGDLVTCESWSNIPLNESFATYGEYLWNEYKYGKTFADYRQRDNYENYMEEAEAKNVDLIRFYYENREDMFDRHSYEKGGLLLHYLRYVVGDEAFFKSLALYLKNNQFKTVEIHQLRLAFEEVTGLDLNWFFNQYFLNSGHAVLDVNYRTTTDSVFVTIEQKQNEDKKLVYRMPMDIDLYYGAKKQTYRVELKKKKQTFAFASKGPVDLVDIDGPRVLLCVKKENKTTAQYIHQYRYGSSYVAKLEALLQLKEKQQSETDAALCMLEAFGDSAYGLREFAIENFQYPKEKDEKILKTLAAAALNDRVSHVRAAALKALGTASGAADYEDLMIRCVGDSSFLVAAQALKSLKEINEKKALAIAAPFEKDRNADIAAAVAAVYAAAGSAVNQLFFEDKLSGNSPGKYFLFYYFANFLTRMEKPVVLNGIQTIATQGSKAEADYLTAAAKGALKRIAKNFDEKKGRYQADLRKEQDQSAKQDLQRKIEDCTEISNKVADALQGMGQTTK